MNCWIRVRFPKDVNEYSWNVAKQENAWTTPKYVCPILLEPYNLKMETTSLEFIRAENYGVYEDRKLVGHY